MGALSFVTVQLLPTGLFWCERQAPLKYSQSAKEVPITRPRPNVIPAASNPKRTCRKPEYNTPRPVSNEIPAPIPNRANAAKAALTTTPQVPDRKNNGTTGMSAPSANRQNEAL